MLGSRYHGFQSVYERAKGKRDRGKKREKPVLFHREKKKRGPTAAQKKKKKKERVSLI